MGSWLVYLRKAVSPTAGEQLGNGSSACLACVSTSSHLGSAAVGARDKMQPREGASVW